jgi:hypothetical protein
LVYSRVRRRVFLPPRRRIEIGTRTVRSSFAANRSALLLPQKRQEFTQRFDRPRGMGRMHGIGEQRVRFDGIASNYGRPKSSANKATLV